MKKTDSYYLNMLLKRCKEEYKEKKYNINFNIQQFFAFDKVLRSYLKKFYYVDKNTGTSTTIYKSLNRKKKFFCYIADNMNLDKERFGFDGIVKELMQLAMIVIIEIDIKNYKCINIKCYRLNIDNEKAEEIINENYDTFFNKLVLDFDKIYKSVLNAKAISSGILTWLGMKNKELIGYYNTKYFEIDAGGKCNAYVVSKKIKIKYKFENIEVCNFYDNSIMQIELSNIYTSVINKILVLTLRNCFETIEGKEYFELSDRKGKYEFDFDKTILGKMVDKEDFEKNLINYFILHNRSIDIPNNIDKLLDNFFKLNNKEQEAFYNSCKSYEKALKNKGIEKVFYLFQAVESMVAYEEKYTKNFKDKSRVNNIKIFIEKHIKTRDFEDIVELWHQFRSKYAHNAIDYNGLFDMIFGEDIPMFKIYSCDR